MPFSNSQYIASPDMWQLFTDRDTSTFLYAGYALFFEDTARTIGKPVYQITGMGNPPNPPYSFIEYGALQIDGSWRVDLNSQGAFDQTVYLLPFDTDNNVQQYYIEFYNAGNVLQFTLEGWPQGVSTGSTGTQVAVNFVPNSQFLTHNNIPYFSATAAIGQIPPSTGLVNFAPGNWYFERPVTSSAIDAITFSRFGSPLTVPESNPRYSCHFTCTTPDGADSYKDLSVRFFNVNTFASSVNFITYSFWAVCNSGPSVNISLVKKYNFGSGGSAAVEAVLTTFSVVDSWTQYTFAFIPGSLVGGGYTIGLNDDDYVEFALRAPPTSASDFLFTDVIITPGEISEPITPDITANETIAASLAGSTLVPNYNRQNLYLPMMLGPNGFVYDLSVIGQILLTMQQNVSTSYLVCDGLTTYDNLLSSADGIPYSRLWNILFNQTLNMPLFGTGLSFVTADINSTGNVIRLSTNTAGAVTATGEGAAPTGFAFKTCHTGTTAILEQGFYANTNLFKIINTTTGLVNTFDDGSSGFTHEAHDGGGSFNPGSGNLRAVWNVSATDSTALAGKYFKFYTTTTTYYMWFKVDSGGTDPAPGGTGIEVDLYNTTFAMTSADVAKTVSEALCMKQSSFIIVSAGTSVPASSYFTFSTLTNNYYVWFKVNSVGTDPAIGGRVGLEVDILSTDTATQVATKIQTTINSRFYAVPDLRGQSLRIWSNGLTNLDLDQAVRFSNNSLVYGNYIGTEEWFDTQSHAHDIGSGLTAGTGIGSGSVTSAGPSSTFDFGGSETRPVNTYVNAFIRY